MFSAHPTTDPGIIFWPKPTKKHTSELTLRIDNLTPRKTKKSKGIREKEKGRRKGKKEKKEKKDGGNREILSENHGEIKIFEGISRALKLKLRLQTKRHLN